MTIGRRNILWCHKWHDNCLEEHFWSYNWLDNCLEEIFCFIIDLVSALKKKCGVIIDLTLALKDIFGLIIDLLIVLKKIFGLQNWLDNGLDIFFRKLIDLTIALIKNISHAHAYLLFLLFLPLLLLLFLVSVLSSHFERISGLQIQTDWRDLKCLGLISYDFK